MSDEYDLKVLVQGLKLVRRIAESPAFRGHLERELFDESIPFPPDSCVRGRGGRGGGLPLTSAVVCVRSDEYLREYARKGACTVYHPVGTCRMGAVADPRTVVDPRLRVKGVRGLRVADASVMPVIPSANTNAAAVRGPAASSLSKACLTCPLDGGPARS